MTHLEEQLRATFGGQPVLVTGHTGFKGSWLTLWLETLGARVWGYALEPDTTPAMFNLLHLAESCEHHVVGDIRDRDLLHATIREAAPSFIFHLAAQPLVRRSYTDPLYTIQTNVLGTANLLDAIRLAASPCTVVVVTSDKCYENREWPFAYREVDALGGHDVYSASKAGAELVTASYRNSFFPPAQLAQHGVALATARAGNVIGGGDWAQNRIVPDSVSALAQRTPISVRNPLATRPWQHVLEPLLGYLRLAQRMASHSDPLRASYCSPWNFGPLPDGIATVQRVVELLIAEWGSGSWSDCSDPTAPHEAHTLRLSVDKAVAGLGWKPRWNLRQAIKHTVDWYKVADSSQSAATLRATTLAQIAEYLSPDAVDGTAITGTA